MTGVSCLVLGEVFAEAIKVTATTQYAWCLCEMVSLRHGATLNRMNHSKAQWTGVLASDAGRRC